MVAGRQLHLFRSRRQRGQSPPGPSEFQSQCFLIDVIRRWIDPGGGSLTCHQANIAIRSPRSRLQRLGVVAGWPDLQFAGPDQKMVFLELKRRGGRLSEAQAAMRAHLRRLCPSGDQRHRPGDRVAETARRPARRVYGAVIAREPPKSDSACRSASHSSSVNSGSSCGRNP